MVEGCDKMHKNGPYCSMHYARLRTHGEVGPPGYIKKNFGWVDASGYKAFRVDGKAKFEHRIVMEATLGRRLLDRENVHHKNGDRLDNRPENLELWLRRQPSGQRVEDLVEFVCSNYADLVRARMAT